MRRETLAVLLAIGFLLPSGCRQAPPKAQTVTIPVKVWVVFASLPSESVGNVNNRGCRLSLAQMKQYIDNLNNNAHIYGYPVKFSPPLDGSGNPVLNIVMDPSIPIFGGNRRVEPANFFQNVVLAGNWNAGVFNLYFTGYVSPSFANVNGGTLDPQQNPLHHTFINDGGLNNPGSVVFVPSNHTLEHEVTHFLLRRDQQGPPYDASQHVPEGSQNILDQFAPSPLIIPRGPGSEQEEIRNRLRNGTFFSP